MRCIILSPVVTLTITALKKPLQNGVQPYESKRALFLAEVIPEAASHSHCNTLQLDRAQAYDNHRGSIRPHILAQNPA